MLTVSQTLTVRNIVQTLSDTYEAYGFLPVDADVIQPYGLFGTHANTLKLVGDGGTLHVLRPEFTAAIAESVAKGGDFTPPLCYSYSGAVFRTPVHKTRYARSQFTQSGVELIGEGSPYADAQIVALLVTALRNAGLSDFTIDIGHSRIWHALIDQTPLSPDVRELARGLVDTKALFGLRELFAQYEIDGDLAKAIQNLPHTFGDGAVIDELLSLGIPALEQPLLHLRQLWDILGVYGVQDACAIDLGIARNLDYYSGFILKGYAKGAGTPICSGGRYDHLIALRDGTVAACGFAVDVDALSLSLSAPQSVDMTVVSYTPPSLPTALRVCEAVRSHGTPALLLSDAQALPYAKANGIRRVLIVDGDAIVTHHIDEGTRNVTTLNQLLGY